MNATGNPVGVSSSFWQRAVPVSLRYARSTHFESQGAHAAFRFAPNLAREAVFFDATMREPLKWREAMAALHHVVTLDERFTPRTREAHDAFKLRVAHDEEIARKSASTLARIEAQGAPQLPRPNAREFDHARREYWDLRTRVDRKLQKEDPALWRQLMPLDPIVTVAPDVVTFEAFAKDEASYGCVYVDRALFAGGNDATLGTTNVDYSMALATQMERLRTYRETRLAIDPRGVEVELDGGDVLREEKIELPSSWLRGFGQLAGALLLPARHVVLPVETVYAILAHLKNHREKTGPRALRFHLEPGKRPVVVVEPWGLRIESTGPVYAGARAEQIAVWGRRRLHALARTLGFAQLHHARVDVHLLGHGLPSSWSVDLGGVRFALALSGWTANAWSSGSNLDALAGAAEPDRVVVERIAQHLQRTRIASLEELVREAKTTSDNARAAVVHLAKLGQVLPDVTSSVFRFRSILDAPLSAALLGDESPEVVGARVLLAGRTVRIDASETIGTRRFVKGHAGDIACEALLDDGGVLTKARCACSHHFRFGLKRGPCRHLLALRLFAQQSVQ
jgi:hypothetical protein